MDKKQAVSSVIHEIVVRVDSIMNAVFYVRDEIKNLGVPDEIREDVLAVTKGFEWLYHAEIRKEVNNLAEKLSTDDPSPGSVRYSISVVRDDLGEQIETMKKLVEKLQSNSGSGVALMLVICHAVDMIAFHSEIKAILDEIEKAVSA